MIYCLTGELIHLDAMSMTAVIDCCGVGYKCSITGNTLSALHAPREGTAVVRLFTYMSVREDAVDLYGFCATEELDMFKLLISVSGIGPKVALSVLTVLHPEALTLAIAAEDAKAIAKAPGVGAKTAARVVLELKDKLAKNMPSFSGNMGGAGNTKADGGKLADARDALLVLGYSRSEVAQALKLTDPSRETEEIIRQALGALMKQ